MLLRVAFVDLRGEEHGWNEKLFEYNEDLSLDSFLKYLSSLEYVQMSNVKIYLRTNSLRFDDKLIYSRTEGAK